MSLYTIFNIKTGLHCTYCSAKFSFTYITDTIRSDNQVALSPDIFDCGSLHGIHLQHMFQKANHRRV